QKQWKQWIESILNEMERRTLTFVWGLNYMKGQGCRTSQLGGLKAGSRRESTGYRRYWVGVFQSNGNKIKYPPPLVEACFATEPDTATAVAGLRQQLRVS
ncbi:hypothetical protein EDD15DRAFT_2153042, partial [Pisolithus albus]